METLAPLRRRQSAQWHHPEKRERETERERDVAQKTIRTSLDVLAQLILFCLAPCFFKTKEESNTNIWSTAGMRHDP